MNFLILVLKAMFLRDLFLPFSATVACENNIGFRIGMESSVDEESDAGSDFKNNESDSETRSFERALETERIFCEGNALIEEIEDFSEAITEIIMDENGEFYFSDI